MPSFLIGSAEPALGFDLRDGVTNHLAQLGVTNQLALVTYGQYLAVIVLGMAFIERTLASDFYASGRNDLERATFSELLRQAQKIGWLTNAEYEAFDRARVIRNPVTHFRHPSHRENIEYRMVEENDYPYAIIEQDARIIGVAVMHMVDRHAA